MKKLYFFWGFFLTLSSCTLTQQDELSTLKIKVLNLETQSKVQEQRISELGNQIEKRILVLEEKLNKELAKKFLDSQSKILLDLEETKKEVDKLQIKIEELQFQNEGEIKTQKKILEDYSIRLEGLELKIKELEKALSQLSNGTQGSNQTFIPPKEIPPSQGEGVPSLEKKEAGTTPPKASEEEEKKASPKPVSETSPPLKEEDIYQRAFQLYNKGDLIGAKKLFEEYLKKFPNGKWVGQSHFYIGEIEFNQKEYEAAILEYQKVIERREANPLKPKAMLRQAAAFLALKDKKAAQILYNKIIKLYPGTEEAKIAKEALKKLK